jgi:predicted NUDIX family phosphoesterase
MSEEVLIIPNNLLQAHIQEGAGCLITEKKEQVFDKILNNQMFMVRNDAEYNFDHKQIIPYVVIRNDNKYLLLQRLSKQTEKRLHNKYSLGIGGHINPESSIQEDNIILNGLYRELNEEVAVGDVSGLHFVGIINDERNDVSRVHLGLLYVLDVQSSEYRVLETEKMTAKWVSQQELKKHYDALETWSQIVYDQYIKNNKKG